mmetsp:Transcript_27348/g.55951  ORF Transcript_27348/g.55951 Transcript_27348/m.55951 type:complete len:285 (+) Transcript_27348:104-958(+)
MSFSKYSKQMRCVTLTILKFPHEFRPIMFFQFPWIKGSCEKGHGAMELSGFFRTLAPFPPIKIVPSSLTLTPGTHVSSSSMHIPPCIFPITFVPLLKVKIPSVPILIEPHFRSANCKIDLGRKANNPHAFRHLPGASVCPGSKGAVIHLWERPRTPHSNTNKMIGLATLFSAVATGFNSLSTCSTGASFVSALTSGEPSTSAWSLVFSILCCSSSVFTLGSPRIGRANSTHSLLVIPSSIATITTQSDAYRLKRCESISSQPSTSATPENRCVLKDSSFAATGI